MDEQRFREAEQALWRSLGLDPVEQLLALASTGTTVRVQEVGEGPPVLFVHGATTCGSSWATLVAALPGLRCLLLDRPGCGLSDPLPRPLADISAMEAFADALVPEVFDGLRLGQADVVGTSLGGYLAIRGAASQPGRVRRLALVGFPLGAPSGRLPALVHLAATPGLGRLMASVPPSRRMMVTMLRQVGLREAIDAGRVGEPAMAAYHSLLRDTPTMRNEVVGMAPGGLRPLRGFSEELLHTDELLDRLTMPTAFMWGGADLYGGEDVARTFAARVPGAELVVLPGLGHAPWMDDVEAVAGPLRSFLG